MTHNTSIGSLSRLQKSLQSILMEKKLEVILNFTAPILILWKPEPRIQQPVSWEVQHLEAFCKGD